MGIPIFDVDARIALLKSDATLATHLGGSVKLHMEAAPEGQTDGFWIVVGMSDGRNAIHNGGGVTFTKPMYVVTVWNRDKGYQALKAACEYINNELTSGPRTQGTTYVGKFIFKFSFKQLDVIKSMRLFGFSMAYDVIAFDT